MTTRTAVWWPVAAASLLVTYGFFYEHFPPFTRVHVPYDMLGYHYPLAQYALESLRQGRFPEWDPSIYCGLSFAGNIQAGLFYPPNWLLLAANLGREHLSYKSLEALVFAHLWLGFVLGYVWLRGKNLGGLASCLGAGIFAYSGYMMSQSNHIGVICGYAWTPLGLRGIDQVAGGGHWRSLWKVAAASALCFLAGYPPTWAVLCVSLTVYALAGPARLRATAGTAAALGFSILLLMVQLLPAREAAALKSFDPKYGAGLKEPGFFLTYFIPNYFDFGKSPIGTGNPPGQYLYLGVPGLFGLAWVARRRRRRELLPGLAVGAASLIAVTNPFNLVWEALRHVRVLAEACHAFNFLEGLALSAALLAALGIDDFMGRAGPRPPAWLAAVWAAAAAAWSARQLWIWWPGGTDFSSGWRAALEPAVMLALFALGLWLVRGGQGVRRARLAAVLLAAVAVDYKVFGTSRRFIADPEDVDRWFQPGEFVGLDNLVFRQLREHPESRIGVGETGPHPTDLRHYGLTTPQGFDPFLPQQYKVFLEQEGAPFATDRLFYLSPEHKRLLALLGVRYFLVIANSSYYRTLLNSPSFRLLEPSGSFFRVFEYREARPVYGWDTEDSPGSGSVERTRWTGERREFLLRSERGGRFVLAEQFFPGWSATVDGRPAAIRRWRGTFQAIDVPPGQHRVLFRFRSLGLRVGAGITALSLAGLLVALARTRPKTPSRIT